MAVQYDEINQDCPLSDEIGQPAQFQFPDCCCRCLAPSPTKEWTVRNAKNIGGNVSVEFSLKVPVCGACWSKLRGAQIQLCLATAFVGLLAVGALWYYDPFELNGATFRQQVVGWSLIGLALLVPAIGVYYLLRLLCVPRDLRNVAYLNVDGNQVFFYNREYQKLYQFPPRRVPDPESAAW